MLKYLIEKNILGEKMKNILRFIKGYRKEAVLGPLFKLCEALLELLVPIIIAVIIDTYVPLGDAGQNGIIIESLKLFGLGLLGLLFSVTAQFFCARAAVGLVGGMRSALFSHLGSLSYTEIDKLGTSTMITRMTSDANQVQTGVNLALRLFLRSPFVVFGALIMAAIVSPDSARIFAVTIAALSVVVFGIMLITTPLHKRVQRSVDGVVVKTRENLSGARVIRAFCKEEDEISEFEQRNSALASHQKLVGGISALMNPLTYVLINVAILFLIYSGAIKVSAGNLTAGQVVALYNYMSQILIELVKFANLIITVTKAVASSNRIDAVFELKSSMTEGENDGDTRGEYAVEFKNAALTYYGASHSSVEGVNISVRHGETVGIIGGTGAGKTTLINLIPRFYDATEGEVLVDGLNVKEYKNASLRKKISVVPQKATLFRGTVRDNMRLGNENATDEDIIAALEIARATDFVNEKGGLDAMIEQGGRNLSGGQKQRLTIARAIASKPEILILDDSASALDYATEAALRQGLRAMGGGTTLFIVSQRTSSIMHADKILVLEDGAVEAVGTHDELIKTSPIYREIYRTQYTEEVKA